MRKTHKVNNTPNWRDSASYEYTLSLSKLGWAWEFLRRNPNFRKSGRQQLQLEVATGKRGQAIRIITTLSSAPYLEDWGVLFF